MLPLCFILQQLLFLRFCIEHLVRILDELTYNTASLCLLILLTSNQ